MALPRILHRQHPHAIETDTLIGLRDRALIGLMVFTFARVGAALRMRVEDYFVQGRRGGLRLHDKGGKLHSLPCHHNPPGASRGIERYCPRTVGGAPVTSDFKIDPLASREGRIVLTSGGILQFDHRGRVNDELSHPAEACR